MIIVKELDIRVSYCIFYYYLVGVFLYVVINFLFLVDKELFDIELLFYKYFIVGVGIFLVLVYRVIKVRDFKVKVNELKY